MGIKRFNDVSADERLSEQPTLPEGQGFFSHPRRITEDQAKSYLSSNEKFTRAYLVEQSKKLGYE